MSQYSLRLPDDLYRRAGELAREQGVSLNQFFLYAITDMVSEVETRRFFTERSGRHDPNEARRRVDELLARVPDILPIRATSYRAIENPTALSLSS